MNKTVSVVIVVIMFISPGYAYNALEQNNIYRNQLNELARQQQAENQNHLLYYKGNSETSLPQSKQIRDSNASAKEKNLYAKKGVQFKVDNENKTQFSDKASISNNNKEELKQEVTIPKNEEKKGTSLKSTAKTGLKSVSNKVNQVKETTLQLNSTQKQKTNSPKVDLKPAVSEQLKNNATPKPEHKPAQTPLTGRNADAE